jgi:adenosylmethionine---8-amino-7-oxononanoate aminotransferase
MSSREWIERDAAVIWHGFTQMAAYADNAPVIVDHAEGRWLIDVDERRYFDAISSLWVTTLGHRVPELDRALTEQLGRVAHTTMLGNGNTATVELGEALAPRVPLESPHFLFASDGASAVEQALKIAFQFWVNRGERGRQAYLAFGGAYHGDTVGSLSLGGAGFGTDLFDPLRFPVLRAPGFDDPDCLETAAKLVRDHADELAAVVIEPLVQGAAGIRVQPAESFDILGEACRDTDVLLIVDEVATGFGRTGTLFGIEQTSLRADLMCLGKGITGGYLPLSATVAAGHVYEEFLGEDLGPRTLYHGHSYGGNALAAAVARRHLELLDEWDVLSNVRERGLDLQQELEKLAAHPLVREVRQTGLMAGVELYSGERRGRRVAAACVRRGVLIRPLGDVVVIMPPLTTTSDEIRLIGRTMREALDEVGA